MIFGVLLFSVAMGALSLAPWVPTRKNDLKRIFELAGLKSGQIFYDLGCGVGTTVFYADKKYKLHANGIELGLPFYLICIFRKILSESKNTKFIWGDFFRTNFSDADAVYLFGLPMSLKKKLAEKLTKELRPGALVISYVFPIEGWQPKKEDGDGEKMQKYTCTSYDSR